jgi:hypothetical protein
MSGYNYCTCRDCFELVVTEDGPELCDDCEQAGCDSNGEHECCAEGTYGSHQEAP